MTHRFFHSTMVVCAIGIAIACAHLTPQKSMPKKPNTPTQGRDLSSYDRGERFGCGIVGNAEYDACVKSIPRARDFLLEHWNQKRRAYAIVEFGSDDALSDSHIFIEPDESGEWHIVWRIERVLCMGCTDKIDELPDIRFVESITAGPQDSEVLGTKILVFRDRD